MAQEPFYVDKQPGAQPVMVAGLGGNRNAKNIPTDAKGRNWSFGLCDCFGDCGTCCLAWFCPCVVYAHNKHRLEHLTTQGTPDPEHGGGFCSSDCLVHGLLTSCVGMGWILQIGVRENVRQRYGIKGGGIDDCCTVFCCSPCDLTQGSREIDLEEQSFGGHR